MVVMQPMTLMWRRCDKTGELPRTSWQERTPYVPVAPAQAEKGTYI